MRAQALQSHQQEWVQSGAPIAEIMSREEATPVEARRRFVFPPKSKLSHKGPAPGLLLDSELSEEEGSGSDGGAEFGDAVGKGGEGGGRGDGEGDGEGEGTREGASDSGSSLGGDEEWYPARATRSRVAGARGQG